jgi:hypothetical protein
MMTRIRFAWKSGGLVLGLLFGKTLGFNYGNIIEFLCVM